MSTRGWAWDSDSAAAVRVYLQVDSRSVASGVASQPRPDVGRVYRAAGNYRGFSFSTPIASGLHTICLIAANIGPGANTTLGCRSWNVNNDPFGWLDSITPIPAGIQLAGWSIDPNTTSPISVSVLVDGRLMTTVTASASRPDVARVYPHYGAAHGFIARTSITDGSHTVCVRGNNAGLGNAYATLRCAPYTASRSPFGAVTALARTGAGNGHIAATLWAIDPDTVNPISVWATVDGVKVYTGVANVPYAIVGARWPNYGAVHALNIDLTATTAAHVVCFYAANVGPGRDALLSCSTLPTTGDSLPAPATGLTAAIGSTVIDLSWAPARSIASPVTNYSVAVTPGTAVYNVGTATTAHLGGLTNNVAYTFTVRATNALGTGSPSAVSATPVPIPPQVTPAPVSTSHYVRNLTGNAALDVPMMRSMGAVDAGYNPSGHRYLVLLQIGGQDLTNGGVLLSATSRFISNAAVVTAMNAYLDGYSTRQKASAPLTLAIGTNNDVDVSAAAGAVWARSIVNPVLTYARKYPNIAVAGADDIEPGFSATAGESQAWLSGYLGATPAPFVFNGSADGCSTIRTVSACNNGWSMTALQWLSGGASPTRISSLPQIYNAAMPLQWKFISLTGIQLGKPRVNFSGPLTEYTACSQARSCGSLSNVVAWQQLWSAISSTVATRQAAMPHGTDLRIN
jgi:hypothetical protein